MSEQKKPEREEQKGSGRRAFLRKGGKVLAYSVPVIYSLQSTLLRAQQTSPGSPGTASVDATATQTQTTP